MFYQDGICFFEDADALSYPDIDYQERLMSFDQMTTQQKQTETDWYTFCATNNQQCDDSYNTCIDQNELVAMPSNFQNDFENTVYIGTDLAFVSPQTAPLPESAKSRHSPQPRYHIPTPPHLLNTAPARKRKASPESLVTEAPAMKRTAVTLSEAGHDYPDVQSESSAYSSFVPTPTTLPQLHYNHKLNSPQINSHQHNISNTSYTTVGRPYTPTVSPACTHALTEHSPQVPLTPVTRAVSVAPNPKLVRTSTMPHQSPRITQSTTSYCIQESNSLASLEGKVALRVEGDLEGVGTSWSEAEIKEGRKILVFSREQHGNDVHLSFRAMSQEQWNNAPYSVSCIWWADRQEAYVTSVDTIQLLELIVGNRFTVEEKNRIRRNLEGFKPETICKGKPDKPESEEFFKTIMGFPNPKPRNIEKDVKAFPWKILSSALHKIVSKYSASYNVHPTHNRLYRAMERPTSEHLLDATPGYEHRAAAQLVSFDPYQRATMPASGTPAMSMHMSQVVQPGAIMSQQYSLIPTALPTQHYVQPQMYGPQHSSTYDHSHQFSVAPMAAPLSAPLTQASYWPAQQYVEAPLHASSTNAQPITFPRDMIETADFGPMPYNVQPPPRIAYY